MSVKPVQKCLQFPLWPCSCLWSWLEDFFSWFVWRLWTVCIHTLSSFLFGPTVVCEDSHKISCSCPWSWSEDWFSWCVWRLWTVCVQILSGFLCGPTVVCEAGLMISSVSSVALQLSVKLVKRFLQLVCVQTVNSIWTDSKLFPLWPCSCLWSWSEDFFSWCAWRLWAVCGQALSCFLCGPVCEAGQKISLDGVCKDCEQYVQTLSCFLYCYSDSCEAGQKISSDGGCEDCPKDFYQDVALPDRNTDCQPCGIGKGTMQSKQTSLSDCQRECWVLGSMKHVTWDALLMLAYMVMCTWSWTNVHTWQTRQMDTHIQAFTHACRHAHTCTHPHTHAGMHALMHSRTHAFTCVHPPTCTHKHTRMQAHYVFFAVVVCGLLVVW